MAGCAAGEPTRSLVAMHIVLRYNPSGLKERRPGDQAMKPRQRQQIPPAHYEALAEWRYALRQFARFSENAARAAGLTPQQHQALLAIKGFSESQRMTIRNLAERLQILHHSAVGLVDRLQRQGYVRRIADRTDRRQVRLTLTSRGEAVLEKLSAVHREQLRRIGPQLTDFLGRLRDDGASAEGRVSEDG